MENKKYGIVINDKLYRYNGAVVMFKKDIEHEYEQRIYIGAKDGELMYIGYKQIVEDVLPELRYNESIVERFEDLGSYIHVSYEVIITDVPKEEVDAMKREAYESESDHLYMAWQKYLALSDDRAESAKEEWLQKVQEIKERYTLNT